MNQLTSSEGLVVLSCFDGISCGQVALERAKVKVHKYYASEVCSYSIDITKHNYPNTIQVGDIRNIRGEDFKDVDIMIGGSPCQSFSFAGKKTGMITKDKLDVTTLEQYLELKDNEFQFDGQSYLFWEYVRLLKEIDPKYFLLENVKMSAKWKSVITNAVGCDSILINSSLVSAQSRERLYWTNIPNIKQPKDRQIYIDDILQYEIDHKYLPRTRLDYDNYDKSKVDKSIFKNTAIEIGNSRKFRNSVRNNGKAYVLRRINPNGILDENFNIRYFTPVEAERLQTLPDNYTLIDKITKKKRYEVCGNGWTVDVVAHIFSELKKYQS